MSRVCRISLILALGVVTTACAPFMTKPFANAYAWRHVHPVVKALESYKQDQGKYPFELKLLAPDYYKKSISSQNSIDKRTSEGLVWSIIYTRVNPQNYKLHYAAASFDCYYENGRRTRTEISNWR